MQVLFVHGAGRLGHLVPGNGFDTLDLCAWAIGMVIARLIDRALRRHRA